MTPYRNNAKLAVPSPFPYRVMYDGYDRASKTHYTFHRWYIIAWLHAWWYCQSNEWGSAVIQVRK